MFHGTSEEKLKKIFEEGLFVADSFVYLTDKLKMARLFAKQNAEKPVVLRVRVTDTSRLHPDLNMYDTPTKELTKRYRVGIDDPLWGSVRGPHDPSDWKTSLKEVNSVIYDGRIPPKDILGWDYA